jgi:UDP-glucose 4-epimerase
MVRTEDLASLYADAPILITGDTGFLGSNLVAYLRQLDAQITRFGDDADIRDPVAVERAVQGQAIIFHMAGLSGAVASNARPFVDLDVNCKGLLVLLEACRKHNPHARIVFPSSRLVYGRPQRLPVDETHPTHPDQHLWHS